MTDLSDLHIHLRVARSPRDVLSPLDTDQFVFPGWFLRVTRNEGHDDVVAETWLARPKALQIAAAMDDVLALNRSDVTDAVIAADDVIREDLIRQLRNIETQVARLPMLRAALSLQGVDTLPETLDLKGS